MEVSRLTFAGVVGLLVGLRLGRVVPLGVLSLGLLVLMGGRFRGVLGSEGRSCVVLSRGE